MSVQEWRGDLVELSASQGKIEQRIIGGYLHERSLAVE